MINRDRDFYVNSANITTSVYEVLIYFRTLSPPSHEKEGQSAEVADEFMVRMSPQHAKALNVLLTRNIEAYEQKFKTTLVVPDRVMDFSSEEVEDDAEPKPKPG